METEADADPHIAAQVGIEERLTSAARHAGIPRTPRYSVLRVHAEGDLGPLLDLLTFGVRVFVVTGPDVELGASVDYDIEPFRATRLLEWARLPEAPQQDRWVVDGDPSSLADELVQAALAAADDTGDMNVGQYHVVHAAAHADVLVTAGAGTGKTETMAERLVFLLSTTGDGQDTAPLGVHEVALVTFTREAAREMRERLTRTLVVRRRLCAHSIQPLTWLLGSAARSVDCGCD